MDLPRTLVFSPRANETSQVLAPAAHRRGLLTEHLTGWRVPEGFTIGGPAHLYAGPLFADAVAADLGVACLEPPDDWLTLLPSSATRRRIRLTTMAEAWQLRVPTFVKPPNDKSFPAQVYREGGHLPGPDAVDADTPVLLSEPVRFTAEFRLHVLDGRIVASSQYAIDGDLAVAPAADHPAAPTVLSFGAALAGDWAESLPSAVVIDVGLLDDSGRLHPAAIEANAAWAAGHYAADPDPVLETVLRAAGPIAELPDRDRRFRRAPATVEL